VSTSTESLAAARAAGDSRVKSPEFRQAAEDILILNGLGVYYANLFRAAPFYSVYEQTADPAAAAQSLVAYRKGRDAWANMAERADKIYSPDISYGDISSRRGHWADRLSEIDRDVAALEKYFSDKLAHPSSAGRAIQVAAKPAPRPSIDVKHTVPNGLRSGSDLHLTMIAPGIVTESFVWFRHVNQAERWLCEPMQGTGDIHRVFIPRNYAGLPYPLQYYFELHTADAATLHPLLNPTFNNQPYYVITFAR